jgi:trimeric autotransporter adhesin
MKFSPTLFSIISVSVLIGFTDLTEAQVPAVITYQGRLQANGTNFSGTGRFKFALVTGTNLNHTATATANAPSGGYVTGYAVTSGGTGYVTAPAVTIFGGGGSGAAAHANISGGAVTSLAVDNPGNGAYTSAPSVTIAPPPPNVAYTTYWSNDGSSVNGSEPAQFVNVPVNNGLFTAPLGDTTQPNMASIPVSLFQQQANLQLRIWFSDGATGFAALDPAQNLTPAPYAAFANTASNHVNGPIVQPNTNGAPNIINGSSLNYVSNGVIGATIAGGGAVSYARSTYSNSVVGNFGTVCGGYQNLAGFEAFVGGGTFNTASGALSVIGGGGGNVASGVYATIAGGQNNLASGGGSMAAGYGAQATHPSSFVWNDGSGSTFGSTAANQFSVRASGGIRLAGDVSLDGGEAYHNLSLSGGNALGYLFGSYGYQGDGLHLCYNFYADANGVGHVNNAGGATSRISVGYGTVDLLVGAVGAAPNTRMLHVTSSGVCVNGTVSNCSDRNVKQDFAPIDSSSILAAVLHLPISEWSYKIDPGTRHIGPMAQDFYSTFKVGPDDTHITPMDEGGLAFAAIQGLSGRMESENASLRDELRRSEKDNSELHRENELLQKRIEAIEAAVFARKSN